MKSSRLKNILAVAFISLLIFLIPVSRLLRPASRKNPSTYRTIPYYPQDPDGILERYQSLSDTQKEKVRNFMDSLNASNSISFTGETGSVPVISWRDASRHTGEYAIVEGVIVLTRNTGKVCFLNFDPDYRRHFTAVIFVSSFPRFPSSPEAYYLRKKVRVKGTIKEYQGKPEIILENSSQIEIIP